MVHKNNLTIYTRGQKRANRAISPYNLGEVTLTTWSWTLTNKNHKDNNPIILLQVQEQVKVLLNYKGASGIFIKLELSAEVCTLDTQTCCTQRI